MRKSTFAAALITGAFLLFGAAPTAGAAECPAYVNASQLVGKAQLQKMTAKFNSFGPRLLASSSHNKAISYLESQAKAIGLKTRSTYFKPHAWLPKTKFRNKPGLDISAAGGITVRKADGKTVNVADAGAVHWSKPTSKAGVGGSLVYLPPDQAITPENSAGKIVIRDFQEGSLPFGAVGPLLGIYLTPDLDGYTDYTRPYLSKNITDDSIAAGVAGAAGVIYSFDLPQKQVKGYYDPHTGTIYRQPEVFVGRSQGEQLKALAAAGSTAKVSVQATIKRTRTRNLIATLPGRSKEKMVLAANTDGNSWVQEDGVIGMLAIAKYYAKLPLGCRPRTLQLVFSSAHDGFRDDGLSPDHFPMTRDIAFGFTIEHLGTREILPTGEGAGRKLAFTGIPDPALYAAGDSQPLRDAAAAATKRRNLPRTAVLKGLAVPNPNQAPSICSMGGLGTFFQSQLVPTLAMISGPWTLYDPDFGGKAIDFAQMRKQVLAAGDTILALDGLPRADIEGDYPGLRAELAAGTKTACPSDADIPLHPPGPAASAAASADVTQPVQPKRGPGGSNTTNSFRETAGGEGDNAWYVFEPTKPRPKKAPVTILMHGYYEYAGHDQLQALIEHTVERGSIVIYPRWQTGVASPCPGPYLIDPCVTSATTAIKDALAYLRSSPKNVQPDVSRASYFGFSFGGIVTANMTNRYRSLGLPKPRVIFFEDPHDGGLTGNDEPALDDSLAGIPSTALVQCHDSAQGVIAGPGMQDAGCNALYPKLTSIPKKNKDLVLTSVDDHGTPVLAAPHGVCAGGPKVAIDAFDWGFCWKVWDALRTCAFKGHWCDYALGDTRRHRYIGTWSDGTPIIGLKVREAAPIRIDPPAPRIPNPDTRRAPL